MIKKIITIATTAIILFSSCGTPKTEDKIAEIKKDTILAHSVYTDECGSLYKHALKMDSILMASTEADHVLGNKAIKAFCDFSYFCSGDSLAPVFLIKASQVATSINNLPQAQLNLERCIKDFPNFKNRGAAMFLLAQLYDEVKYLNDEGKAEDLYKKIISEYPNSEWATNARAARALLGKSDEEIIKQFNKQNKK